MIRIVEIVDKSRI